MIRDNLISSSECNYQPVCSSRVIDPVTLCQCDSDCNEPKGCKDSLVAKIPVVLSECAVQIDVECDIRLEEKAFDIKTIDKKVCLTQCHLVPHTNKLFIEGFVQKNIQYSTVECVNEDSISGNVQHTTLNIPFKCCTAIKFDKSPEFGKSFKTRLTAIDNSMCCPDTHEDSWIHYNKYHEPVYCELQWEKILESDIYNRNRMCAEGFTDECCFLRFTEKMVVYIGIKVLQNKQVYIPNKYDDCDKYDDSDKYDDCHKCDDCDKCKCDNCMSEKY